MKKSTRTYLLAIILITAGAILEPANGQEMLAGSGLETAGEVSVAVEPLPNDAKEIGLTKNQIRTKAELRLRSEDIGVKEGNVYPALYLRVNVHGPAYNIYISVYREALYKADSQFYKSRAATWERALLGTHGGETKPITENINRLLDEFLNEYLKTNR